MAFWGGISDGTTGNMNVSLAFVAQMSGKELSIYLEDEAHTCENSPSWASLGKLRHFKVL